MRDRYYYPAGEGTLLFYAAKKLDEVADWLADFRKIWKNRFDKLDDLLIRMQSKTNIKSK